MGEACTIIDINTFISKWANASPLLFQEAFDISCIREHIVKIMGNTFTYYSFGSMTLNLSLSFAIVQQIEYGVNLKNLL